MLVRRSLLAVTGVGRPTSTRSLSVADTSELSGMPSDVRTGLSTNPVQCDTTNHTTQRFGELGGSCQIWPRIVGHHVEADRGRAIDAHATVSAIAARWQENLSELQRFAGTVVPAEPIQEIQRLATQFLSGRSVLIARRIADRRSPTGTPICSPTTSSACPTVRRCWTARSSTIIFGMSTASMTPPFSRWI